MVLNIQVQVHHYANVKYFQPVKILSVIDFLHFHKTPPQVHTMKSFITLVYM